MDEANYFHSTVYCFSSGAYNEVIRKFNTSMQDVSARCWYSVDEDMFCLKSPTAIGQQANCCLTEVLCQYIEDELTAAERDDRAPLIQPFAEGVVEDHDITREFDNDHPGPEAPSPSLISTRDYTTPTKIMLHFINLEESTISRITLFHLGGLPDGMVERVLCSTDGESKKAIHTGVTARAVRWDAGTQVWVFNGRVGSPMYDLNSPNLQLLRGTRFNSVSDMRVFQKSTEENQDFPYNKWLSQPADSTDAPTKKWEFKPGETTDIRRFLEGMGDTYTLDPEMEPEVPEDAARFLSQSTHPPLPQGRRRVPARTAAPSSNEGIESNSDNDDDDDDADDDDSKSSHTTARANREANINRNNIPRSNISRIFGIPANSNHESTSNETKPFPMPGTSVDQDRTPTSSNLLPFAYNICSRPAASLQAKSESQVPSCGSSNRNEGLNLTNTKRSSNDDTNLPTHIDPFSTWDGKYAAVDRIGLAGIAPNQATWEHENQSPKKKPANRSGLALRQTSASSRAATPSLSAISGAIKTYRTYTNGNGYLSSGTSSSSLLLASPGRASQDSPQSSSQNWAHKKVLPKAGDQNLINFTAATEAKPSPKPPPGLFEYTKNPAPSSTAIHNVVSNAGSSAQSSNGTIRPDLLIDVSETESKTDQFNNLVSCLRVQGSSRAITARLSPTGPLHQQLTRASHSQYALGSNDITERLQITSDDSKLKKYTMNQKAKKRQKSYKKPAAYKAILPKPEPIPAAQTSKAGNEAALDNSAAQALKQLQPFRNPPQSSSPDEPQPPKKSSPPSMNALQQLLSRILSGDVLEGANIHVQFGLILLQQPQFKEACKKGAITKETLQSIIQSSESLPDATFFRRLTTSTTDALYLLDLLPGSHVSATTRYEIIVKNAEGALRTIKMESTKKDAFHVEHPSNILGTSYIHYPIRIWDAKATVEKAKVDNSMSDIAAEFMSSMQTIDEAPSFMAKIPSDFFGVEKVYAKRRFIKTVSKAVELVATEVQDLVLESVNDSRYNFKASVLPGEEMSNSQRLWWESELRTEMMDDESAVALQGLTDHIVSEIDGVGYANKGPWEKVAVAEDQGPADIPFW